MLACAAGLGLVLFPGLRDEHGEIVPVGTVDVLAVMSVSADL